MQSNFSIDGKEILVRIIKYLLEGTIVGIAVALIPKQKASLEEIMTIALVAAATFSLLDTFSPAVAASTKAGIGLALGSGIVGGVPIKAIN